MRVKSVLSVIAVGLMLVVGIDYVAYGATGQSLVLGKANKANKTTTVKRTTGGPALTLKVKPGSAPLAVSNDTRVTRLNADKLDGLDSTALRNADKIDGLDSTDLLERVTAVQPASCQSLSPTTTTYQKLGDVGTFTTLPTTRYTRIEYSTSFQTTLGGATSVVFQLRVDDEPTTLGRAVYLLKNGDATYGDLTGVFPDLAPGAHTLSVWSRSTGTSATLASVDSGCSTVANNVYLTEFR